MGDLIRPKCWTSRNHVYTEFNTNLSPKGTEWRILYRHWRKGGNELYEALVANYDEGLTAYEAWQKSELKYCPAFHMVICEQIQPFPYPLELVSKTI